MGDRAVNSGQYTLLDLPTTSQTLLAVLELCQRPASTDEQLARSIQLDPLLSASLLALSAGQLVIGHATVPIAEQMVGCLGKPAVQAVTLEMAWRLCRHPQAPMRQAFSERLWHRTVVTAKLASAFAILSGYGNPPEAYLVGLLQGLGPLRVAAAAVGSELMSLESDEQALQSVSRQLFTEGHSAWASQLIRQWGLPGFLADALRYQDHDHDAVADAHLLIRISNLVARLASADRQQVNLGLEMARRWFGVEPELGREIVNRAQTETRQVAVELSLQESGEYSPQPLLALSDMVGDLLQIQTLVAVVSAEESAGVEPGRVFSRVLTQAIGCKQYRILSYDAAAHQLVGFTDGRDALHPGDEGADWRIALRPARSAMAMAFDQNKARLLGSASKPHSVADEQMLGMLGEAAAICLPLMVAPERGLLVVAGGSQGQMQELSNRTCYLQRLCTILARTLHAEPQPSASLAERESQESADRSVREMTHELSNPLTVASNYLAILEHKLLQAGLHYDELAIVGEELQRANLLLEGWQGPTRSGSRVGKVDVNRTLARLVHVYRATALEPRNISLALELDEQQALADVDEVALQQILRNLIGNAIEAVSDGGHILVKTSAEVFMDSGEYVEILLLDDGPGLPADVRGNIFKPVQSTKGSDHAGLGLSIVKSLIDKENGSIAFRSSAQGTRFQVYLPK